VTLPGFTWRILAHNHPTSGYEGPALDLRFRPSDRVEFDELVIGEWFHIEQMSDRSWWFRAGERNFNVRIPAHGDVIVEEAE